MGTLIDSPAIPKPVKSERVNEKRKGIIRRKDREFQASNKAPCIVGKDCFGPVVRHHIKHRRYVLSRWSVENTITLCIKHHMEIHTLGERTFNNRYLT